MSTKGFFTASNSLRRSSKLFFMWKDSFSFWCKSVLPATSSTALYHRVEVTKFQVTQSSTLWGSTTTLNKFFMGNSSHTCTLLIWNEKLCTHRIMSQKSIKTNYSVDLNIIDIDEESRFWKKSENPFLCKALISVRVTQFYFTLCTPAHICTDTTFHNWFCRILSTEPLQF